MAEKVTVKGHIIVPEKDIQKVVSALPEHIDLSLKEPGCLVFKVQQDVENKFKFNVYEEFVDQHAYESHRIRIRQTQWGQVTWNVARYYKVYDEK